MIRMQERIQLNELTRFQASIELVFFRHPFAHFTHGSVRIRCSIRGSEKVYPNRNGQIVERCSMTRT